MASHNRFEEPCSGCYVPRPSEKVEHARHHTLLSPAVASHWCCCSQHMCFTGACLSTPLHLKLESTDMAHQKALRPWMQILIAVMQALGWVLPADCFKPPLVETESTYSYIKLVYDSHGELALSTNQRQEAPLSAHAAHSMTHPKMSCWSASSIPSRRFRKRGSLVLKLGSTAVYPLLQK